MWDGGEVGGGMCDGAVSSARCNIAPVDELDHQLMRAWSRITPSLRDDPDEAIKRLKRALGPTLARPLRSWSLALRADDKRIDADEHDTAGHECVILTADDVRALCAPVRLEYPGVSVNEAAHRLGVNKTTIYRRSHPHDIRIPRHKNAHTRQLWRDIYINDADRKRDAVCIWAPSPVDPAGEVWSMPWGILRRHLAQWVAEDFAQRLLRRAHRCGGRAVVRHWRCPTCARASSKLYLPFPVWTLPAALAAPEIAEQSCRPMQERFTCRRCAGLIYESAERTARPARHRHVNVWHRFIQRISAGLLQGHEVTPPTR